MALPSSGQITFQDIATELGLTGPISLDQAEVRALAGIPSGPISLADLLGKSALLFSGTLTIGYQPYVADKLSTPEMRGCFSRYRSPFYVPNNNPIGAIAPSTVEGSSVYILGEEHNDLAATKLFIFAVSGQTIPLDFFSVLRVKNGSTVVAELLPANATAERVNLAQINDNQTLYPATRWTWTLTSKGQILPTSGTRTIEIG